MVLVRRNMGVVALGAILCGRGMQQSLSRDGFLVGMALQAEGEDRGRGQLYTGHIIGDTYFMAGKTALRDRRMDGFCLELAPVTFEAFCTVNICVQRDGMLGGKSIGSPAGCKQNSNRYSADQRNLQKPANFITKNANL